MQLDIQNWTLLQILSTAVIAGIVSGLVCCTIAAYLLPNVEEEQNIWEK